MAHRLGLAAASLASAAFLGISFTTNPSKAADIPVAASAIAAGYSWSGCYIGANLGWLGSADRFDTSPSANIGLTPAERAAATRQHSFQNSAMVAGGAQAGCLWQRARSPLAFGIELDFNGFRLKDSRTTHVADFGNLPEHFERITKELTWFSTLRGRLGYAIDRRLAYATGGLAVANISSSFEFNNDFPVYAGSGSSTRYGWTAGGGLEYGFGDNWTARIEYLYIDLGTFSYQAPHAFADSVWYVDAHLRSHVVRLGVNYRFGRP
jgi:outer membrane immunogenic protein